MSILVATDFSPCSAGAVRLAASLARRRHVSLLLVHAVEPLPFGDPVLPVAPAGWASALLTAAEETLAREATNLRTSGLAVETRVIVGQAATVVLDTARDQGADLIVVGTHGRKGTAHLFLGSVAETIVRHAPCPVLVAREPVADLGRWDGSAPLHLVVASDGSGAGHAALSWAAGYSRGGAGDVSVVRMYAPSEELMRYGLDDPWGDPRRDGQLLSLLRRDLERDAQASLGGAPHRVRLRAISHDASEALDEEAATLGGDAVVLGVPAHRWTGSAAVAVGPTLRRSRLPVFCVPEGARAAERRTMGQPVRSILIATDLSEASSEVIAAAYGLLRARGGRVELCTVHEVGIGDGVTGRPLVAPLSATGRAALEERLRALVPPDAAAAGITTHVSVPEGATAAASILTTAERLDVELIAVGSHGRTGWRRAALGSVAEEVARHSKRPVLLVRGRTERLPS